MKRFRLKSLASLAAVLATTLVAGCAGIPQDDRYQIHDGGRSNTRAEAPVPSVTRPS
jgi:outer membrane murein-binding lipoprotein Lpp